jgi:hypothetical protein
MWADNIKLNLEGDSVTWFYLAHYKENWDKCG